MHGQSRIFQGPHVQLPTPYAYVFGQEIKQVLFANSHSVSPILMSDLWSNRTDECHFRACDESRELFGRYMGRMSHPIHPVRMSCDPLSTCLCLFGFYCLNAFVICCTNWSFSPRTAGLTNFEGGLSAVWLNPSCTNRLHDCFVLTINKTVMPSTRPTYQTHLSCQLLSCPQKVATKTQAALPPSFQPHPLTTAIIWTRKLWKDVRIEFSSSEILLNHYWKASITITIERLWKEWNDGRWE